LPLAARRRTRLAIRVTASASAPSSPAVEAAPTPWRTVTDVCPRRFVYLLWRQENHRRHVDRATGVDCQSDCRGCGVVGHLADDVRVRFSESEIKRLDLSSHVLSELGVRVAPTCPPFLGETPSAFGCVRRLNEVFRHASPSSLGVRLTRTVQMIAPVRLSSREEV
jgi:hypothetical protein